MQFVNTDDLKRVSMLARNVTNAIRVGIPHFLKSGVSAAQGRARAGKAPAKEKLHLVDRLQLGGKRSVAVVSFSGLHYLIAMGEDAVTGVTPISYPNKERVTCGYSQLQGSRRRSRMRNGREG